MTNKQKISGLCSILDELFNSFHIVHSIEHPELLHPGEWRECVLGHKHLEWLKTEYEKTRKGIVL